MGLIGRQTEAGLLLDDIGAAHRKLLDRGVESKMVLTVTPWGGMLALYRDNNSNFFI